MRARVVLGYHLKTVCQRRCMRMCLAQCVCLCRSVANSDTTHVAGSTLDTRTVTCAQGYFSSGCFCHCKRNANTQKYVKFDEKTKTTIIREQKARQNRKLIPGSPRIDGQLRPIHIGRAFSFIFLRFRWHGGVQTLLFLLFR